MKSHIITASIIILALFISSCKEDAVTNNTMTPPINEISGVIENWQSGRMNLKAVVSYENEQTHEYFLQTIDSTYINPDRSFRLRLITPIINSSDSFFFPDYGNCSNNVYVTPGLKIKNLMLEVHTENDTAIGYIMHSDADTLKDPNYITFFYYNNINSEISGTRECLANFNFNIYTTFNWTVLKGWNPMYLFWEQVDSTHYRETYSNIPPGNLKWRYYKYLYPEDKKIKSFVRKYD